MASTPETSTSSSEGTLFYSRQLKLDGCITSALTCSICLDPYFFPVTLKCGHTFCKLCEKKLPSISTAKLGKTKACPECRAEYTVIEEMAPTVSLRKIMNTLPRRDITYPIGERCPHLDSFTESKEKCSHCDESFCVACMVFHQERILLEVKWLHSSLAPRLENSMKSLDYNVVKAKQAMSSRLAELRSNIKQKIDELIVMIKQRESEWLKMVDKCEKGEGETVDRFIETCKTVPGDVGDLTGRLNSILSMPLLLSSVEEIKDLNEDMIAVDHKIYALEYFGDNVDNFRCSIDLDGFKTPLQQQEANLECSNDIILTKFPEKSTELLRLEEAIVGGDVEKVKRFYDMHQSLPDSALKLALEENVNGKTPLATAAFHGNLDVVRYFVENCGANIFAKNESLPGDTAFHTAAGNDQLEVMQYFLDRDLACLGGTNKYGRTPILRAVQSGGCKVVKFLVEAGYVNVEEPDEEGNTLLMDAVFYNNVDLVKYLIEVANADTSEPYPGTESNILHIATENEDATIDLLEYLAQKCPVLIEKEDVDDQCPLSLSVSSDNVNIFRIFAEANPTHLKNKMNSLLHIAATYGSMKVGPLLIEKYGTPVDTFDKGLTPLHCAVESNKPAFVSFLLKTNTNLRSIRSRTFNETPLSLAKRLGFEQIHRLLLEG